MLKWISNTALVSSLIFILGILTPVSHAEVVTDGSLGATENLTGPNFIVRPDLGQQQGSNLFHSFSQFNLDSSQTAVFQGPNTIENIISRVTGGDISSIDGTIASPIPQVNLFLLNPAGVMLGPNASINIGGSFHVGTANQVEFADGAVFSADLATSSTLSVAPPSAFGFLGNQSGTLSVNETDITLSAGEQLTLVGQSVELNVRPATFANAEFRNGQLIFPDGVISVPDGRIVIAAIESAASVGFSQGMLQTTAEAAFGDISITRYDVDISGQLTGSINVRGDNVVLEDINITSTNSNVTPGPSINIESITSTELSGTIRALGNNIGAAGIINISSRGDVDIASEEISVNTTGSGRGGIITVAGENVMISGDIFADSDGSAAAGIIDIQANNLLEINEASIEAISTGSGAGGVITLVAQTLNAFGSGIFTATFSDGFDFGFGNFAGIAGDITITADDVLLSATDVFAVGAGDRSAGTVTINATNVTLNDGNGSNPSTISTGIFAGQSDDDDFFDDGPPGTGTGGNIIINSQTLVIDNDSELDAFTESAGRGGNITLAVSESVSLLNGGFIDASTGGRGNGGNVNIITESLVVSGRGDQEFGRGISDGIGVNTLDDGNGGAINIMAATVLLEDSGLITAISDTATTGNSGSININATESITILEGARIDASSNGLGNGGNVNLNTNSLLISGPGTQGGSSIQVNTFAFGDSGSLNIFTADLNLRDSGSITAVTSDNTVGDLIGLPDGDGGTIRITSERVSLDGNSFIAAGSFGDGNAGSIDISVSESTTLTNASSINSGTLRAGNAGTLSIDSPVVTIDSNSSISANTAGIGRGGNVIVTSAILNLQNGSDINASTVGAGDGGNLMLFTDDLTIDNAIINVSTDGPGNAGRLVLAGTNLSILNGGLVNADTTAMGNGGNIIIGLGGSLLVSSEPGTEFPSAITANTTGLGQGGIAMISATDVLIDGGLIATRAGAPNRPPLANTGNAGSIFITTDELRLTNSAALTSQSFSRGNSGVIDIDLNGSLFIENASFISTETVNSGGGVIDVDAAGVIYLADSFINADNFAQGGNISLKSQLLVLNENSLVRANVDLGQGGNINVDSLFFISEGAPIETFLDASSAIGPQLSGIELNLGDSLVTANTQFFDGATLIASPCLSRTQVATSSFRVVGSQGIPDSPDDLQRATNVSGSDIRQLSNVKPVDAARLQVASLSSDC